MRYILVSFIASEDSHHANGGKPQGCPSSLLARYRHAKRDASCVNQASGFSPLVRQDPSTSQILVTLSSAGCRCPQSAHFISQCSCCNKLAGTRDRAQASSTDNFSHQCCMFDNPASGICAKQHRQWGLSECSVALSLGEKRHFIPLQ